MSEQTILDPRTTEALTSFHVGDPDSVETVQIRSAWRDLSCKMSGSEAYRQVRYPGQTSFVWPDGDRLPARGSRSSERRGEVVMEVPIGTIVQTFARDVYHGSKGKCSVSFGLVRRPNDENKDRLLGLTHRTLRARPVYEVRLPDGTLIDVPRREY